jgi:hypothetical protein
MKGASAFAAVMGGLMLALAIAPVAVLAGTELDPEMTDVAGDATNGRSDMDILKAWVEDETNTTLTFRILTEALSLFSPRSDWQSLPQVLYDYYFTYASNNFAARASIPVHGPLAAFAGFSLYRVEYGATGDNLTFTAADGSVSGSYNSGGSYVEMRVLKENIGGPRQGDVITHMWCAVYYQPRGQDKQRIDTAMSFQSPGRDYLVKGEFDEYYDVRLVTGNLTMSAAPRVPARFNITIRSSSSTDIYINLTATQPSVGGRPAPGYVAVFSRNESTGIHVQANSSVSLFLIVTPPDNATNGTDVGVMVGGTFQTEEGTNITTNNLNLVVQVRFIPPKPPVKETTIIGFIIDHALYIGAVIAVLLLFLIALYWTSQRRKRTEADDLVAFAAYVEAQKRSREAGAGDVERSSPP